MSDDLKEYKADRDAGEVMEPVDGAGGKIKSRKADLNKKVDATADKLDDITPENGYVKEESDVTESFESLFEGMELTEDFKSKLGLVFESAVYEAVVARTAELEESLAETFQAELEESVSEAMDGIVENLDNYLDYVVKEWAADNELAIESGIKLEMAESLMDGLKTLFAEHNVSIDEETIDVVSALEEELQEVTARANAAINAAIELEEEVKKLHADKVFTELSEGLTTTQIERFRILSERLSFEDAESFGSDLSTLKESFFKAKAPVLHEEAEEQEILTETVERKNISTYDTVNLIASAISKFK